MAQQLTPLQELDPGFIFSERQLQLDHAEFVPGNIHKVLPSAEFAFKSAAVIGISVGVLAGMTAIETSQGSTQEARAVGCDILEDGVLNWYDPCPGSAPTTTNAPADTTPTTSPALPVPNPTNPRTPTPTTPRTPTTPPTTTDLDVDEDTYFRDQGFFPDVDDNSFGLGEQGAIEARARGIDIDSGSDEANRNLLIAYTVNPEDWEQTTSNILAVYGVMVMTPTTTTTTTTTTEPTPATSEAEIAPAITVAEVMTGPTETGINTTEAEAVDDKNTSSTIEAVLAVNNSDDSGKNNNVLLPIGGILAGIGVVFGGILLARRKKQDQEEDAAGYSGTDTSPVAGN